MQSLEFGASSMQQLKRKPRQRKRYQAVTQNIHDSRYVALLRTWQKKDARIESCMVRLRGGFLARSFIITLLAYSKLLIYSLSHSTMSPFLFKSRHIWQPLKWFTNCTCKKIEGYRSMEAFLHCSCYEVNDMGIFFLAGLVWGVSDSPLKSPAGVNTKDRGLKIPSRQFCIKPASYLPLEIGRHDWT